MGGRHRAQSRWWAGPYRDQSVGRAGPAVGVEQEVGQQLQARDRLMTVGVLGCDGWIVQRLEAERNTPTDTAAVVQRLEADVRALRKLVAS